VQHQEPCAAARGTGISACPRAAGDLCDRAKFCEQSGVPLTTRRFAAVAATTLQALDSEIEQSVHPKTNRDYQVRVACCLEVCKNFTSFKLPKVKGK
jgi:hypothetical protein